MMYHGDMKIERISENSIKCTLTSFDLSVRDLNIKELAYGTDKVRKLFTEMMTRASNEVGFEADGTPIMIEAIPLSSDSIQLVITKVDNPEELDARFSRFSPGLQGQNPRGQNKGEDWLHRLTSELLEGAAGFLAQVQNAQEAGKHPGPNAPDSGSPQGIPVPGAVLAGTAGKPQEKNRKTVQEPQIPEVTWRAIGFDDLNTVLEAVKAAAFYSGESTLYKKPGTEKYALLIKGTREDHESFAKVCNILTEYGYSIHTTSGTGAYYEEHYDVIAKSPAISRLAKIR